MNTSLPKSPLTACSSEPRAGTALAADASGGGAIPSSTAPSKYIQPNSPGFRYLGHGIDSLYLSYQGKLSAQSVQRLEVLKQLAQSKSGNEAAKSQVQIGSHCFEVLPNGAGNFKFVLRDDHYRIKLSAGQVGRVPVAAVQVSSKVTHSLSLDEIDREVSGFVRHFAEIEAQASCSRVDLHLDFQSAVDMESWTREAWVSRADDVIARFHKNSINGWNLGMGGDVSFRLYDKALQLAKTHKYHIHDLWLAHDWDSEERVWRAEFQIVKAGLKTLGVFTLDDLESACGPIWGYCSNNWLRLCVVNHCEKNRSRWKTHELWSDIQNVPDWSQTAPAIRTHPSQSQPSEEQLFVNGLGPITSYMAITGIGDPEEGVLAFLNDARAFHADRSDGLQSALDRYLREKIAVKRKRFNLPVAAIPERRRGPDSHGAKS